VAGDLNKKGGINIMPENYYVIRNTETGEYFRGNGTNRWGKYFNQASIYRVKGTALSSLKEITSWRKEPAELVTIRIIECTADID
jgi:hypothetical protein